MSFSPSVPRVRLRDCRGRARQIVLATSLALLSSATGNLLTRADDAVPSAYAVTLREHGIEPDAAGLGKYLRQLHSGRREAQRLIQQLGSPRFADRESAMTRLKSLPIPPIEELRMASKHRDPEIRWRAINILSSGMSQRLGRSALTYATFKTIERDKVQGLAAELLRAVALCDERYLRLAARAAVRTTVRPDDAPQLWKATKDNDKQVVVAAIGGLGAALGTHARDDLRRLLEHETEEISLEAARALADQGDRSSLGQLVKLLDAASLEVRMGAVQTLRLVSDAQHNYASYEDASERKEAIGRWAAWVEGKGRGAKLNFPLKSVPFDMGRMLITIGVQNKVIELDASGMQVWEKSGLNDPWASTGLTNGNRLISCYSGRYVVEYDARGKEVWRKEGLPSSPFNVRRLENGNTLIACSGSNKVVEIRPDGSTAWEITINGRPLDVRRLSNDRTLVTLKNTGRVVEVDRAGKVHWAINGLRNPVTAQRLENGNTLVAETGRGRVAEWDRGGKIVWQQEGLQNTYSAERLFNGNTLIARKTDVREVDRQGKIIWRKQMTGVGHATRY